MRDRPIAAALTFLIACCAVAAVIAAPAPADARPRALLAYLPTEPAPKMPLLFDLAERGLAYGLVSPTLGGFSSRQAVLDVSQGSRISTRAYEEAVPRLELVPAGGGAGRIALWAEAVERAEDAPGEAVPGLLAERLGDSGLRAAYAGVLGFEQVEAISAADAGGRIPRVVRPTLGRFTGALLETWRSSDLLVTRLPGDEAGLEALDAILGARRPEDLVIVLRAPPGQGLKLLPAGIAGPGVERGRLHSATTRLSGFVAATDIAPTLLEHFGVAIPDEMSGRVIESRAGGDPEELRALAARFDVVVGRRTPVLRSALAALLLLLAGLALARGRAGVRTWMRLALLAAIWLPGLALLTAALRPTRTAEMAILVIGSLGLAAATDRALPWPRGPALPAAVTFLAHAVDLAAGSILINASIAGPNPRGGARFFGVGNELEATLATAVLIGAGAALARRRDSLVPRAFAAVALVAAVIIGAGRLGADVGGVITLGAGGAAAVLASLPGGLSRRAVALAVAAPAAAVLVLVGIDAVSGGGAHLTSSVIEADSPRDLVDVVERRLRISFGGLAGGTAPLSVGIAILLLVAGVLRRRRLLAPLDAAPGLRAGIAGAFFATVVGALANDSGPVILLIGTVALLLAVGYARGDPRAPAEALP